MTCRCTTKPNLSKIEFPFRNEPKITLKELVKRDSHYYLTKLESKIFNNWIWGPRQNREATKSIIKPIDKELFDERNKKLIPKVITEWKYYIRTILRFMKVYYDNK